MKFVPHDYFSVIRNMLLYRMIVKYCVYRGCFSRYCVCVVLNCRLFYDDCYYIVISNGRINQRWFKHLCFEDGGHESPKGGQSLEKMSVMCSNMQF